MTLALELLGRFLLGFAIASLILSVVDPFWLGVVLSFVACIALNAVLDLVFDR